MNGVGLNLICFVFIYDSKHEIFQKKSQKKLKISCLEWFINTKHINFKPTSFINFCYMMQKVVLIYGIIVNYCNIFFMVEISKKKKNKNTYIL